MLPVILCYSKCSTCQKAEKWLKNNKINYTYRPIKEQNPTKAELLDWLFKSGIPLNKFFNTSGLLYKELNLKDKIKEATKDELIDILSSNGMIVKRPILITDNKVLVGFNESEWVNVLK